MTNVRDVTQDALWPYKVLIRSWMWRMVDNPNHTIVTMHPSTHRLHKHFAQRREDLMFVDHANHTIVTTEAGAKLIREATAGTGNEHG